MLSSSLSEDGAEVEGVARAFLDLDGARILEHPGKTGERGLQAGPSGGYRERPQLLTRKTEMRGQIRLKQSYWLGRAPVLAKRGPRTLLRVS